MSLCIHKSMMEISLNTPQCGHGYNVSNLEHWLTRNG